MKKNFLLFTLVAIPIILNAQAPNAIPYQGVARNAAGNILASQNINLRISIHDASVNGTIVFRETFSVTTTSLGLFSINIGTGVAITGILAAVNWGNGAKFLQVEMNTNGGNSYTDMGTTQFMSVPYALFARSSAVATHYIGESYGGGIVFYIYDNGQHGLIAAPQDMLGGQDFMWSDYDFPYQRIGSTSNGLGAGVLNTTIQIAKIIQANYNDNFAAKACANFSAILNGITYGGWYLPSSYELNLLYLQKNIVGGFSNNNYWSSNEAGSGSAVILNFSTGNESVDDKKHHNYVRPIRTF